MSAGHSPGPWVADGINAATETGKTVAITCPDLSLPSINSLERMKANARLIAAAPDLLEACLQYRDDLLYPPVTDEVRVRRLERVLAVIAKARGQ